MSKSGLDPSKRLHIRTDPVNVKRHTKPCLYYQTGSCPLSADMCDFVHVLVPEDPSNPLKSPQATLRTKICRFYAAGSCKQGVWCRFKHPVTVKPLKQEEDASAGSPSSWDDEMQQTDSGVNSEEDEDDGSPDIRDVDPSWKSKQELHPKYRTRPCRNFLSGKCPYGDACSYIHIRPETLNPSAHRLVPQSPRLQGESLLTGVFSSPAYGASIYPSPSSETASSPILTKRHTFAPLPQLILPTSPQSTYPATQSPIAYVSAAIPAYPIYATPILGDQQASRPRSASQPVRSVSAQKSIYYRTKTCKFYATTGQCSLGDKCTFIHAPSAANGSLQTSSEIADSQLSSSSEYTDTDKASSSSETSERRNFHKIQWRVVGGGVIIGKNKDSEIQPAKDKGKAQQTPADEGIICAFYPACPYVDACSFRHIDPTAYRTENDRDRSYTKRTANSRAGLVESIIRKSPETRSATMGAKPESESERRSSNRRNLSIPIPPIDSFFKNTPPTITATPSTARPDEDRDNARYAGNTLHRGLAPKMEDINKARFAKSTPSTPVSGSSFPRLFPAESP